jgi:hypothetical protein
MSKVTINKINTPSLGDYTQQDLNLIPAFDVISQFVPEKDNVEFSIYNEQGLLEYIDYNYTDYTVTFDYNTQQNAISTVNVDVEKDVIGSGYEQGNYTATYNFFRNQLLSSFDNNFYIKQISSDRTEVRIANNNIENEELENAVNQFETELSSSAYFEDFQINLGNNNIFTANNILIDTSDSLQYTVLIKLYEPLEEQFTIKDTLWVTTQTSDKVSYQVSFEPKIVTPPPPPQLKGPNFDIPVKDVVNNSTTYQDLDSLFTTVLTSSYNELQGVLADKGITVNVNYSDFNNFVYFSSAEQRVRNFYYKVGLIEEYNNEINLLNAPLSSDVSSSLAILEAQKKNIIENFDGYEKYQYYSSGSSDIYPKNNRVTPYSLYGTGSAEALNWLASQSLLSSNYDLENPDRLVNTLPNFIVDNTNNTQYLLFTDMIGQHFDNIWIYTKDISNRFNADNRLNYGISKDIIADAIRSMGVNLYQNNFSSDDLFLAFASINRDQTNPTSLPLYIPYTGNEEINTFIPENYQGKIQRNYFYPKGSVVDATASPSSWGLIRITQDWTSPDFPIGDITWDNAMLGSYETNFVFYRNPISLDDTNKEIYKRIYHNLPYLLKKKGSIEGLRALINCYGIPDTILRISEFGGKDKTNSNDWDYFQNKFNYGIEISGSTEVVPNRGQGVNITWGVNEDWNSPNDVPNSIMFRFKPKSPTISGGDYKIVATKKDTGGFETLIALDYTGSLNQSSSYSGSIPSSSNEYAELWVGYASAKYTSVSAPFYNGNWWSVYVEYDINSSEEYTLRVAESIYNGNDGFKLGYTASNSGSSIVVNWKNDGDFQLPYNKESVALTSNTYYGITSSYQEVRFYNTSMSQEVFHDYTINPYSIEGINFSSSANNLIFRGALGSDLDLETSIHTSIHPKITGSLGQVTQSFASNSAYKIYWDDDKSNWKPNTEFIYYDQPAVGIKNRVSKKIKSIDNITPSGNVLTPYRTIQQRYPQSESYTRDINYLEVAFSPQNEINDDINSSFGYFNIGEYIGDPRQVSESNTSYQDLDKLRDNYFEKYYKSYDWKDYIRLIKYFDNSLFKMIKDFTPAKTSVSTGVVIKQHLLERNKHKPAQIELSQHDYSGSIASGFIEGGTGGVLTGLDNSTISTGSFRSTGGVGTVVETANLTIGTPSSEVLFAKDNNTSIVYNNNSRQTNRVIYTLESWSVLSDTTPDGLFNLSIRSKDRDMILGTIYSIDANNLSPNYPHSIIFNILPAETIEIKAARVAQSGKIILNNITHKLESSHELIANPLTVNSISGSVSYIQTTQDEFYNGEFNGNNIIVTDGNLNNVIISETADDNSFIARWNTVTSNSGPIPDAPGTAAYSLGGIRGAQLVQLRFQQSGSDDIGRREYFDSLSSGDILTVNVINGVSPAYTGGIVNFEITSVTTFIPAPQAYVAYIDIIPVTISDPGFPTVFSAYPLDYSGAVSIDFEIIYDEALSNFQTSLIGDEPLQNNVIINRESTNFQDVDYSSGDGVLKPTNYSQILNSSATPAQVPDSNYTQARSINSRYKGSRVSSPDFNVKRQVDFSNKNNNKDCN